MTDLPPGKSLVFLLHDVARLYRRRMDQRAQSLGLTSAQWRVLASIARTELLNQEPLNQATLAELMDMEPITVSRHVDRMEAAGMIERRPDPADRRAHQLFLTEAARPLVNSFRTLGSGCVADALAGISEAEIETRHRCPFPHPDEHPRHGGRRRTGEAGKRKPSRQSWPSRMSTENTAKNVVEMKAAEPSVPKAVASRAATRTRPKSNRRRYVIMASVPLLLLAVGGWFWLTGGRYASTDNAYLQQDRVTITADVSGRIVEAAVRENERGQARPAALPHQPRAVPDRARRRRRRARLGPSPGRAVSAPPMSRPRRPPNGRAENLDFKQKALDRQRDLLKKGVASQATYDSGRERRARPPSRRCRRPSRTSSRPRLRLGGDPAIATDQHPAVLAALAKRDQAALDLENTEVHAPADGSSRRPIASRSASTSPIRPATRPR